MNTQSERDNLANLCIDGSIIVMNGKEGCMGMWVGLKRLRKRSSDVVSSCEEGTVYVSKSKIIRTFAITPC
jgi:hypothetical protein